MSAKQPMVQRQKDGSIRAFVRFPAKGVRGGSFTTLRPGDAEYARYDAFLKRREQPGERKLSNPVIRSGVRVMLNVQSDNKSVKAERSESYPRVILSAAGDILEFSANGKTQRYRHGWIPIGPGGPSAVSAKPKAGKGVPADEPKGGGDVNELAADAKQKMRDAVRSKDPRQLLEAAKAHLAVVKAAEAAGNSQLAAEHKFLARKLADKAKQKVPARR